MKYTPTFGRQLVGSLTLGAALAAAPVFAGTSADSAKDSVVEKSPEANNGDWCTWLSSKPGTFYKDKTNPYISEFRLSGRVHVQAAHVDGSDTNGSDFNDDFLELRRVRLGVSAKFLNYFAVKADFNLEDDDSPGGSESDHDIEYADINNAYLTFDAGKAFGLTQVDSLTIGYGKRNVRVGFEGSTSSNKIKTVERSALTNKLSVGGQNPLGVWAKGKKGDLSFDLGIFSSDSNSEVGGWNDGKFFVVAADYNLSQSYSFDKTVVGFDFVYNDADSRTEDDVVGYDWAGALNLRVKEGAWDVNTSLFAGDNNGTNPERDSDFYGIVILPTYKISDKLEGVFRYQYAKSSGDQGLRLNSRYTRAGRITGGGASVNGGRGDEHQSLYAGLNYYLCGNNAKILTGIEYETLDTPGSGTEQELDATTLWLAFRTSF